MPMATRQLSCRGFHLHRPEKYPCTTVDAQSLFLWEVVQKIAVVETIFRDQWFKFASLWQLIQQKTCAETKVHALFAAPDLVSQWHQALMP